MKIIVNRFKIISKKVFSYVSKFKKPSAMLMVGIF